MGELENFVATDPPKWGVMDLFYWKMVPDRFGGGIQYIQKYKDAWVKHHKEQIKDEAYMNDFPPELLAGICWIEVGGDPHFIDRLAFGVRAFDYSGPNWVDENLTMTNRPSKTSFGAVSMQLATAAHTLGLDVNTMTYSQLRDLSHSLGKDRYNISLVAKHIVEIMERDNLPQDSDFFSMDDVKIVGARYNRGLGLSIERIRLNTSYGDFIVKHWDRFVGLLV